MMGRTVYEVTKMSSRVKAQLMQRPSEAESEETVPEVKVSICTFHIQIKEFEKYF